MSTNENTEVIVKENKENFELGKTLDFNSSMRVAKMFLESGYFQNEKSLAQVAVKIVAGAEFGLAPFAAMQSVNFITGRPVVAAATQGSQAKKKGYSWQVKEHNEKICILHFYRGAEYLGESSFSMDDAKKAGLAGKDNWMKWPRNMLFARAMSNGIKWFAPDTFGCAVYDPEELQSAGMSDRGIARMTARPVVETTAIETTTEPVDPLAQIKSAMRVTAEVMNESVEVEDKPKRQRRNNIKLAEPIEAAPVAPIVERETFAHYVIQGGEIFAGRELHELGGLRELQSVAAAPSLKKGMTEIDLDSIASYIAELKEEDVLP